MKEPSDGRRKFSWSKASIIATSVSLGLLLIYAFRGLGNSKESVDGLIGALQVVALPGALVSIILVPYMVIQSGEEWVEKRQAEADFLEESLQAPRLSLLRGSGSYALSDELLHATIETPDRDPEQLVRAAGGVKSE